MPSTSPSKGKAGKECSTSNKGNEVSSNSTIHSKGRPQGPPTPVGGINHNTKASQHPIEATYSVPYTEDEELTKRLQAMDDHFSWLHNQPRIKFITAGGNKLANSLGNLNPWKARHCGRKCFSCDTAQEEKDLGKCNAEGVCYRITCLTCKQAGIKALYTGETGNSSLVRGANHITALNQMDTKNALVKHSIDHHQEMETHPEFTMQVLSVHKTALHRQVTEAVLIERTKANVIMNSKGEWNGSKLPRVILEVGDKVNQKDYNGQQQQQPQEPAKRPRQKDLHPSMSKSSGTQGPAKGANTAVTTKRARLQDPTTPRRPGRPTTSATPSARPPSATSRGPPALTKALPNGKAGRAELRKPSCPAQLAKPSSSQEYSQSGQVTHKLSMPFTLAKASQNS